MALAVTKEPGTKKLSLQIYELLKKDIVECRLEPGGLLEEASISERYEIGRTPFREACQRLEAEGLVEIVPHRGAFVASFSYEDINDLFELQRILEPAIAELACRHSSGRGLEALEENVVEGGELIKMSEPSLAPRILENGTNFHVGLARLTKNKELRRTVENIHDRTRRMCIFMAQRRPQAYGFHKLHAEMLEALKLGNAVEVRDLMNRDIELAWGLARDFGRE